MKLGYAVLSLGLLVVARNASADRDRYDVGAEVPTFTLKAVNGDVLGESYITIDRYFGEGAKDPKKALMLSFFATYCEPCKREIPLLAALDEQYRDKGLQVVLVSIDTDAEKIEMARALAKDAGVRFPVLSDRFNIVAKRYLVAKLPNSYLVGPDGKVTMANVGYNEDISKRLIDEIRKALGEPTGEPVPDSIAKYLGHLGASELVAVGADSATTPAVEAAPAPDQVQVINASAAAVVEAADDTTPKKAKTKGKRKRKVE